MSAVRVTAAPLLAWRWRAAHVASRHLDIAPTSTCNTVSALPLATAATLTTRKPRQTLHLTARNPEGFSTRSPIPNSYPKVRASSAIAYTKKPKYVSIVEIGVHTLKNGSDVDASTQRSEVSRVERPQIESPQSGPNLAHAPALPLKSIDVGEPDANAEYFIAKRAQTAPMFQRAYYEQSAGFTDGLVTGQKFILYGQKGTGKTALLRHLEYQSQHQYATEFVVFRKEIMEEAQLASLAATFSASFIVNEDKIKETKFYYHAMKRLLLVLLLSKTKDLDDEVPEDASWFRKVYSEFKSSSIGQIAALVTDSVVGSLEAVQIDVDRATKGIATVNPAMAIKRSNDAFQKFAFSHFEKHQLKARVFLDEMHFAYRDKQSLGADAALVRDTVSAIREINEKLIERGVDSMLYMSIRSEFLEHQEIAVSDIAHTIESYGTEISWESAPFDRQHPIFEIALTRLQLAIGKQLTRDVMLERFFPVRRIEDFLEYTWGKPRDIVRFFKAAKLAYPNNASLTLPEYRNVIRRYSQAAWQDVKAALTAFVPKNSIPVLENCLQKISAHNFDNSIQFDRITLKVYLKPAYDDMVKDGVTYDIDEFIKLLYIVGIFYIRYKDNKNQMIVHQFHRGNRHPAEKGAFFVHRAVARAFS